MKKLVLVSMILGLMTAQNCFADAQPEKIDELMKKNFSELDTNKDGQLNLEEAAKNKNLAESFSVLDVNKDLSIDFNEFCAFGKCGKKACH